MGKKISILVVMAMLIASGVVMNNHSASAADWMFKELWENKLKLDAEADEQCGYKLDCEKEFYAGQSALSDLNMKTYAMNEEAVLVTAFDIASGTIKVNFNNRSLGILGERGRIDGVKPDQKLTYLKVRWFYEGSEPDNSGYYKDDKDPLIYEYRGDGSLLPNQEIEIKMGEPVKDGKKLSYYYSYEYVTETPMVDGQTSTRKIAGDLKQCLGDLSDYQERMECQLYYPSSFGYYKLGWPNGQKPQEVPKEEPKEEPEDEPKKDLEEQSNKELNVESKEELNDVMSAEKDGLAENKGSNQGTPPETASDLSENLRDKMIKSDQFSVSPRISLDKIPLAPDTGTPKGNS